MAPPKIPKEMRAIQVVEYGKPYKINTVPVPDPTKLGPHDLLIKVAVASYCHTDSMIQRGAFGAAAALPLTASHEGAGTVVAAGSSAGAGAGWAVGDRAMAGLPFRPCGECADCAGPDESLRQYCARAEGHCGVHRDGFLAEYALCDARTSTRLPGGVGLLGAAPLACAGRTAWRGVGQAGLEGGDPPGRWLAVVGSGGGLGHLCVQFAKKRGLRVVGVDARAEGLEVSRAMGADVVVDAREGKEAVVKQVQEATGGAGADATVNLSDAEGAAALAAAVTRMHGTMVQIAQPENVVIPFQELVFRDIRVKGSVVSSPGESRDMVKFIAENGIEVKTNVFDGLDEIESLLDMVHSGKIQGKAVIIVDPEQIEKEKQLGAKH